MRARTVRAYQHVARRGRSVLEVGHHGALRRVLEGNKLLAVSNDTVEPFDEDLA